MKHYYTNELELKSLLIRIKYTRQVDGTVKTSQTLARKDKETIDKNAHINKYIKWYTKILNTKYETSIFKKAKSVQAHIKERIIKMSENCCIDAKSYEHFGFIIMEMINHIMTKSQFRGYSYQDDFISDAVYKILKYLDNFDHTKISSISGQPVNAFAYISQIIHNSFLFIILDRKKDQEFIAEQVALKRSELGLHVDDRNFKVQTETKIVVLETVTNICQQCLEIIENQKLNLKNKNFKLVINYSDFEPSIEDISFIHSLKKTYKNVVIKDLEDD